MKSRRSGRRGNQGQLKSSLNRVRDLSGSHDGGGDGSDVPLQNITIAQQSTEPHVATKPSATSMAGGLDISRPSTSRAVEESSVKDTDWQTIETKSEGSDASVGQSNESFFEGSGGDAAPESMSTVDEAESEDDTNSGETIEDSEDLPRDPWAKCAKAVWEYEASAVAQWKEDINNLLIFSGLSSAVLTGFIVPLYVMLAATQALISMSAHLSIVAADSGHTTIANWLLSLSADTTSSSGPSATIVAVCVLWFIALLLSIGAASLAISIIQWLHHHTTTTSKTPRQSVRVWYFRRTGLSSWGVEQAITILPLLLQLSLLMFLVGLAALLWTLSTPVAAVTSVLVVLLLLPTIATPILPSLFPHCPYKSSQAWWVFCIWRSCSRWFEESRWNSIPKPRGGPSEYVVRMVWNLWSSAGKWKIFRDLPPLGGWIALDSFCMQTLKEPRQARLKMLVEADARVMDEGFLATVVKPCLKEAKVSEALPAFYDILAQRAHDRDHDENQPLRWYHEEQDGRSIVILGRVAADMLDRIPDNMDNALDNRIRILQILGSLLFATPATEEEVRDKLASMWSDGKSTSDPCLRDHLGWLIAFGEVYVDDLSTVLDRLSAAHTNLSTQRYLQFSASALKRAADVLPDVRDSTHHVLKDIAAYFGSAEGSTMAQDITSGDDWYWFLQLLRGYHALLEADATLLSKDLNAALTTCITNCPNNDEHKDDIQRCIQTIQNISQPTDGTMPAVQPAGLDATTEPTQDISATTSS